MLYTWQSEDLALQCRNFVVCLQGHNLLALAIIEDLHYCISFVSDSTADPRTLPHPAGILSVDSWQHIFRSDHPQASSEPFRSGRGIRRFNPAWNLSHWSASKAFITATEWQ